METTGCRRRFLLFYFGEEFSEDDCSCMCDNCKTPKDKVKVTDEMKIALESLQILEENYKIKTLVDFVMGKQTKEMKDYRFNKREGFGKGKDKEEIFWHSVFRHAMLNELIRKDIETYGVLKMTKKGLAFLEKPFDIEIPINLDYDNQEVEYDGGGKNAVLDETLVKMLKDLHRRVA